MPTAASGSAGYAEMATVRPAPTGMSLITPDAVLPETVRSPVIAPVIPLPLIDAETRTTSADVSAKPMETPPVPSLQLVQGPSCLLLQASNDRQSNPAIEARFMGGPGRRDKTNVGYQRAVRW